MDPAKRLTLLALKNVVDPELGLDVVSLGLVYGIQADERALRVQLTLTTQGCPMGETILGMAHEALAGVAGEREVQVDVVWSPPWSPQMLSVEARAALRA